MQTSGGDVSGLPDSVLGIVTARVDLLPPAEKELLRDAAVMGGVVWSDGLRAVSAQDEQTVDGLLRALGRKEFLRRERRSAVLGATEHSFVHTLVRDAVYGQLPRPERVDRHVRVARWIESLPKTGARTAPSCSRTTTSRQSSLPGARASTCPTSSPGPRRRSARPGFVRSRSGRSLRRSGRFAAPPSGCRMAWTRARSGRSGRR